MHEIFEVMNLLDVLVWSWHVKPKGWLVMKVAWSWYEIWYKWMEYVIGMVRTYSM